MDDVEAREDILFRRWTINTRGVEEGGAHVVAANGGRQAAIKEGRRGAVLGVSSTEL